jgi:hypothetical protein
MKVDKGTAVKTCRKVQVMKLSPLATTPIILAANFIGYFTIRSKMELRISTVTRELIP